MLVLLAGPLTMTTSPTPVGAHAGLVASSPRNGQVVGGEITVIDFVFDEAVNEATIRLLGPEGSDLRGSLSQPTSNHLRIELASPLAIEGKYRVSLELVSADTDSLVVTLDFMYEVGADPALPVVGVPVDGSSGLGTTTENRQRRIQWIGVSILAVGVSVLGVRVLRSRQKLRQISVSDESGTKGRR